MSVAVRESFHSSKEDSRAFRYAWTAYRAAVSIPQRKIQECAWDLKKNPTRKGFHSSKEDSRGEPRRADEDRRCRVSIPQRKIQESPLSIVSIEGFLVSIPQRKIQEKDLSQGLSACYQFPFLKGRFKRPAGDVEGPAGRRFPFLKGRFKSIVARPLSPIVYKVSIPQRKIQEGEKGGLGADAGSFPFLKGRFKSGCLARPIDDIARFHSSKEDSRGLVPESPFICTSMFPFLKGRFKRYSFHAPMARSSQFPFLKGRFKSA